MSDQTDRPVCDAPMPRRLLAAEPRVLTQSEVDGLWRIFQAIGDHWQNTVNDSAGLRSSWLEFITQRSQIRPSYVAEYVNALEVMAELDQIYGDEAFETLFSHNVRPTWNDEEHRWNPPMWDTALDHAKGFVVDEFIQVQLIAGGFKGFMHPPPTDPRPDWVHNYNGFIAGSRFNRVRPVKPFEDGEA